MSLALVSAALVVMIVLFCLEYFSKHMRIMRTLTRQQASDAVKFGEAMVSGRASESLAQKQQFPFPVIVSMTTSPKRIDTLHTIL